MILKFCFKNLTFVCSDIIKSLDRHLIKMTELRPSLVGQDVRQLQNNYLRA